MIFVYLPANQLLAETESASWGSIKAELSNSPAGKLVVSQRKAGGLVDQPHYPISSLQYVAVFDSEGNSITSNETVNDTVGYYTLQYSRDRFLTWKYGGGIVNGRSFFPREIDKDGYYSIRLLRSFKGESVIYEWSGVPINPRVDALVLYVGGPARIIYSKSSDVILEKLEIPTNILSGTENLAIYRFKAVARGQRGVLFTDGEGSAVQGVSLTNLEMRVYSDPEFSLLTKSYNVDYSGYHLPVVNILQGKNLYMEARATISDVSDGDFLAIRFNGLEPEILRAP
ncbi:MAG: hypothetical protein AAB725_01745 [Patescibacteria group bacterium]